MIPKFPFRRVLATALLVLSLDCQGGSRLPADYQPGEVVPEAEVIRLGYHHFFTDEAIPDSIFALMQGRSFKADCTVRRASLRYVRCLHKDAEGRTLVGEMVVNQKIVTDVLDIFQKLYEASYPIQQMRLIDIYDADDERSMMANNSSCFNFRFISHTRRVSKHGLGMAIDINPLYNPYHKHLADGTEVVEPAAGRPYLDRKADYPYKIVKGDLCYRLFLLHGFKWGGDWRSCKDYQHFEMP